MRYFVIITWHRHNNRYIETLEARVGISEREKPRLEKELILIRTSKSTRTPVISRLLNAAKKQEENGFFAQLGLDPERATLYIPMDHCDIEIKQDLRVKAKEV